MHIENESLRKCEQEITLNAVKFSGEDFIQTKIEK